MVAVKTRILIVVTNLGGGGAERVIAVLLEHLDRTSFEPRIVIFEDIREYALPEGIPVICLHKNGWYDYPKLVWKVSREYRKWKPGVVLSVLRYSNIIAVLAKLISFHKTRILLSEHGIPSFYLKQNQGPLGKILYKWMPRGFYKYADKVICVSETSANDVNTIFKVPSEKIKVIYNPLDIRKILSLCNEKVDHPWFKENRPIIVSVGSLIEVKGYPYLLRAFSQAAKKLPMYLMILGKGDQESVLKDLARQLGIQEQVAFLGFQDNPFKYVARSSVFVLSSLTEAFPMVVLEAMTCGIPVVSSASPGPSEIIKNGINGLLVPKADENALAQAMLKLINDDNLARDMAQEARKLITGFSVEKVIKEYEGLFQG